MRGLGDTSDGEASAKQKSEEGAGGEEEEENIDVVKFVKETKFGESWLVKQAIELQENTRRSVQQNPTRRNKWFVCSIVKSGWRWGKRKISTTFSL